jgi:uncharacterized DUF497 family protein
MSPTAFKHGVEFDDIRHGIRFAVVVEEVGEDPTRYLVLGLGTSGDLLEIVILDDSNGPVVIHAMKMRSKYEPLLTEGMESQ